MSTNANEFILSLERFTGLQPDNVAKIQRAVTIELAGGLMRSSPVDTGRFRGNWQTRAEGYATGTLDVENGAPFGNIDPARQAEAVEQAKRIRPFTLTGIANNLPYGEALNNGHSGQAPKGFVEREIARVSAIRVKAED